MLFSCIVYQQNSNLQLYKQSDKSELMDHLVNVLSILHQNNLFDKGTTAA